MKKTIFVVGIILVSSAFLTAQDSQNTKNTADQVLRSTGRVNPSTLGMEFELPIGSYASRGQSLPLGLSYSSKVWRFEEESSIPSSDPRWPSLNRNYAAYASDSAAGWTSSLAQPYIEYTGDITHFDGNGRPWPGPNAPGPTPVGNMCVPRITVFLPGGESHELRSSDIPGSCGVWDGTFLALDGSGLKYVEDSVSTVKEYRLYLPDGSFYDFKASRDNFGTPTQKPVRKAIKLTDVNGNYIHYNEPNTQTGVNDPYGSWTDQLGRVFPIMIPLETPQNNSDEAFTDTFTLPGMSSSYRLTWKRLEDAFANPSYELEFVGTSTGDLDEDLGVTEPMASSPTLFSRMQMYNACGSTNSFLIVYKMTFNYAGTNAWTPFNPYVLASVELPNNASYEFKYNVYGEVEQIYYPAGGHEEFDYAPVASLANMDKAFQQTNRGVTESRVYENDSDSNPAVSRYYAAKSDNNFRTTVVNPDGTQTDNFMHRGLPEPQCNQLPDSENNYFSPRWGYDAILSGRTYETRTFSGGESPHIIQRTFTKWEYSENADTAHVEIRDTDHLKVQYYPRVHSTQTLSYDGTSAVSAVTKFEYDTYRDINGKDWPGSPLNVTARSEYSYSTLTDSSPPTPIATSSPQSTPPSGVIVVSEPTTGALARRTETSYKSESSYIGQNLLKLPTQILVKDGSLYTKAKTQIGYDGQSLLDDYSGTVPGWSDPGTSVRGLPTSKTSWYDFDGTNGHSIQTQTQYNKFGSTRKTLDANQNLSQVEYTDNFSDTSDQHTYAFPTLTISAAPDGATESIETKTSYSWATGLPVTVTNLNALSTSSDDAVTTMDYADPATSAIDALLRIHKVTAPNGQQTIMEYGAGTSESARWINTKSQIDSSTWKEGRTWYDGLMRDVRTKTVDDAGDVYVLTCYDVMGRVSKVSNPFRGYSSQTCATTTGMDWTINTPDTAGRPWKVTAPDSSIVETNYSVVTSGDQIGTVVTVHDQAGKERRSVTNALGQLTRVDEPISTETTTGLGDKPSPYQHTDYSYDVLNNLLTVNQGSQTRTFAYDALSRLTSATNLESGTIIYGYDYNGNLTSKKDARNIVTTYTYDALDRVNQLSYATPTATPTPGTYQNSPTVSYYYDSGTYAKGKLTKVTSSVSTTEYTSFDILGRVTASKQTTQGGDSAGYIMGYTYNLAGALVEETYPSGRKVRNTLDVNGDLSIVESRKTLLGGYWKYASSFQYNAAGAITKMRLGNGNWESTAFNERLQPIQIGLGKTEANTTNLLKLDYTYSTSGNHDNNGNILSQTITVPNSTGQTNGFTAVQSYTYDELNRLKSAVETVGTTEKWKQTFQYDRYGNRNFDQSNTSMPASFTNTAVTNPTISTSTNRITSTGWTYDAAGNTLTDAGGQSYVYDGENKQVKVSNGGGTLGEYYYDGDGKRVKKVVPNSEETTIFVYDAKGDQIAEYSTIVASVEDAKVNYLTNDSLGSPRINTDRDGNVTARHDYHPFGEEILTGPRFEYPDYRGDTVRKQFSSKERDGETGLDFFEARYYSSKLGRFVSPDEFAGGPDELFDFAEDASDNPTFYANLEVPQSLNKYQYTYNNPLNMSDEDGHDPDPICTPPPVPVVIAQEFFLRFTVEVIPDEIIPESAIPIVRPAPIVPPSYIPLGKPIPIPILPTNPIPPVLKPAPRGTEGAGGGKAPPSPEAGKRARKRGRTVPTTQPKSKPEPETPQRGHRRRRPSTEDDHTKPRSGDKQPPEFGKRRPKRPQDLPPKPPKKKIGEP